MLKGNGTGSFSGIKGSPNRVTFWTDSNTIAAATSLTYQSATGRLGIQRANPQYNLDVQGDIAARNFISSVTLISYPSNGGFNLQNFGQDVGTTPFLPNLYNANGNLEVKLVVYYETNGTSFNNFQLQGSSVGAPVVLINENESDGYSNIRNNLWVYESIWKPLTLGNFRYEMTLHAWRSPGGTTTVKNAYMLIRPRQN
jgi:hypothetical protein